MQLFHTVLPMKESFDSAEYMRFIHAWMGGSRFYTFENMSWDPSKGYDLEYVSLEEYPDASFTIYRPQTDDSCLPVVVYIHGGGWSLGNADSVAWFVKLIASNGYVVCNVDYALAPEYPYPASTIQLVEVINYIYEHAEQYGIDRNSIFIFMSFNIKCLACNQ